MAVFSASMRRRSPYQPIADLLAHYARRDAEKLAIVDLDQETLDQLRRARSGGDRHRRGAQRAGRRKGSRVLLLSDETSRKLLIWLASGGSARWSLRSISSSMRP
jgi:acyl-CoA synthetase (AMP-forming)/AMP-acid ligase II